MVTEGGFSCECSQHEPEAAEYRAGNAAANQEAEGIFARPPAEFPLGLREKLEVVEPRRVSQRLLNRVPFQIGGGADGGFHLAVKPVQPGRWGLPRQMAHADQHGEWKQSVEKELRRKDTARR